MSNLTPLKKQNFLTAWREEQVKLDNQQAKLDNQQAEIDELKERIRGNSEVLTEWDAASLVMCGVPSPIACTFFA